LTPGGFDTLAARPSGSVVRKAQRLAFATFAVALAPVVVEAEGMLVLSGRYTGNGADDRAIYVGFRPDVVIVDMDDPVTVAPAAAVIRTSTMVGDLSKDMDGANPPAADRIQSLTTTGFVVGTYATVNEAGRTYHWVAFRAAAGELNVGSYPGDGVTDARSIPGVGFGPEYVIVMSGGAEQVVQRSSAMLGDLTHQFDSTGFADGIEALEAAGFRVGLDPRVNAGSTTTTTRHGMPRRAGSPSGCIRATAPRPVTSPLSASTPNGFT
jgi:hypothetical protein